MKYLPTAIVLSLLLLVAACGKAEPSTPTGNAVAPVTQEPATSAPATVAPAPTPSSDVAVITINEDGTFDKEVYELKVGQTVKVVNKASKPMSAMAKGAFNALPDPGQTVEVDVKGGNTGVVVLTNLISKKTASVRITS